MSSRPVRVALVLPHPPKPSETFVTNELRSLMRSQDVLVTVLYARPDGSKLLWPTTMRGSRGPDRSLLKRSVDPRICFVELQARLAARKLMRLLSDNVVDIVHAQFLNFPAQVALELGRELSVPVTAMGHAADYLLQHPSRLSRTLFQLDHVFAISDDAVRKLVARGAKADRTSVVRASTDPDLANRIVRTANSSSHKKRVVTVARLVEKKGLQDCLDAARILKRAGTEFEWLVIGDGPLYRELSMTSRSIGIDDVISFVGARSHDYVLDELARSDVAVLPCRRAESGDEDGIPVFLLEAAAMGIPIVTTHVGGIVELLPQHYPGIVSPGDGGEIAGKLAGLIEGRSGDQVALMRQGAMRRYRSEFAPEVQVSRYLSTWNSVLCRGSNASSSSQLPL